MAPGMQVPTWGSGPPLLPLSNDVDFSHFVDGVFAAESANACSGFHKVELEPDLRLHDIQSTDTMSPALGSQLTPSPERETAIVLQVDAAHSSLCGSTLGYTTSPEKVWLVPSGAVPIIAWDISNHWRDLVSSAPQGSSALTETRFADVQGRIPVSVTFLRNLPGDATACTANEVKVWMTPSRLSDVSTWLDKYAAGMARVAGEAYVDARTGELLRAEKIPVSIGGSYTVSDQQRIKNTEQSGFSLRPDCVNPGLERVRYEHQGHGAASDMGHTLSKPHEAGARSSTHDLPRLRPTAP
jgi:hypothetical protein